MGISTSSELEILDTEFKTCWDNFILNVDIPRYEEITDLDNCPYKHIYYVDETLIVNMLDYTDPKRLTFKSAYRDKIKTYFDAVSYGSMTIIRQENGKYRIEFFLNGTRFCKEGQQWL